MKIFLKLRDFAFHPIILGFVLGLGLGFATSSFFGPSFVLAFDGKVSAGNLLQGGATLLTGFIVALYFQRQAQDDRAEKEIILKHLDLIFDGVQSFEAAKESESGIVLTNVTAALKNLSMKCRSLKGLLDQLKYSTDCKSAIAFEDLIKDLRKLSTETPIKGLRDLAATSSCDNTVKDGMIRIAEEKDHELDAKIEELKTKILWAQIVINRSREKPIGSPLRGKNVPA